MPKPSLTTCFVEQIANFPTQGLSEVVLQATRTVVLDTFGAMVAAASPAYSVGATLYRYLEHQGGAGRSSVVGYARKVSAIDAALTNGTLAYYCDIEPHHVKSIVHAPASAVPGALAVAEMVGASGRQFMEAVVLGIDGAWDRGGMSAG